MYVGVYMFHKLDVLLDCIALTELICTYLSIFYYYFQLFHFDKEIIIIRIIMIFIDSQIAFYSWNYNIYHIFL